MNCFFSVCGVETGDWYISMGEMNKILKQGLDSGEQTVITLNQDRQRGESPSQASWGWSLGRPYWVKGIQGHQYINRCRICEHQTAKNPSPPRENGALHIFVLSYQTSFMSRKQKCPKVLGVEWGHLRLELADLWESAATCRWEGLPPDLCGIGQRCLFASDQVPQSPVLVPTWVSFLWDRKPLLAPWSGS